jgi:hypothetical protein
MGQCHSVGKSGPRHRKRFAHIAEEEEPGRRNTIWMRGNGALANIDFAIREQVAKVIVCPAVAEAKLEHVTVETANQFGGHFKASALRL